MSSSHRLKTRTAVIVDSNHKIPVKSVQKIYTIVYHHLGKGRKSRDPGWDKDVMTSLSASSKTRKGGKTAKYTKREGIHTAASYRRRCSAHRLVIVHNIIKYQPFCLLEYPGKRTKYIIQSNNSDCFFVNQNLLRYPTRELLLSQADQTFLFTQLLR